MVLLLLLFAVIGNNFGGTDGTDFQVPDMRGRIPLGKDNMGGSSANRVTDAEADSLGSGSGLQLQPVGSHTHSAGAYSAAGHTHPQNSGAASKDANGGEVAMVGASGGAVRISVGVGSNEIMLSGVSSSGGAITGTSGDTSGSSSSSNNVVQPYQTGNYIIKK